MLRSCPYCGRIHDMAHICPQKQVALDKREAARNRKRTDGADVRFRNTSRWRQVRDYVYHRDRCLCLCCLAELEGTDIKYNTEGLSVHHIVPLREDMSRRDDAGNLITVCRLHHEMCEEGAIPRGVQVKLAELSEQGTIDMSEALKAYALEG